jgi:hypothetical protein
MLELPVAGKDDPRISDLKCLIDSCEEASFGIGGERVFDQNYRKARKMDPKRFLTSFDPYSLNIIDAIAQVLLPSISDANRGVRAELYGLNVITTLSHSIPPKLTFKQIYSGPSGKFKAHVDTPRSANQFGSLVVCLPCGHRGEKSC